MGSLVQYLIYPAGYSLKTGLWYLKPVWQAARGALVEIIVLSICFLGHERFVWEVYAFFSVRFHKLLKGKGEMLGFLHMFVVHSYVGCNYLRSTERL